MNCEFCGALLDEAQETCPQCGATRPESAPAEPAPDVIAAFTPEPPAEPAPESVPEPIPEPAPVAPKAKKPLNPALRFLLGLCTTLLCAVLSVALVATALVWDIQRLTSEDGITAIVEELLCERPADLTPGRFTASFGDLGDYEAQLENVTPENLVDVVFQTLKDQYGDDMKVTKDQVAAFVEQSGAKEFLAEKTAGYANDLLTGNRDTTVADEEILNLIDDNTELVEEVFGVELGSDFRGQVETFLDKHDINAMIQTEVLDPVENLEVPTLGSSGGETTTLAEVLEELQALFTGTALWIMLAVDLVLAVLIWLTKRLRFGPALVSVGTTALSTGLLLSLPVALLQLLPVLLSDLLGLFGITVTLTGAIVARIAPVHYGMAIVGLLLIVAGGIVKTASKKRARAAVS